MNKVYRVIWNTAAGTWVAASEFARGRGKSKSGQTVRQLAMLAALPTLSMSMAAQAQQIVADGTKRTASGVIDTGTASTPTGHALYARNNGTIDSAGLLIVHTAGALAHGAYAESGGQITIGAGSSITTTGNGYGLNATGTGTGTGTGGQASTITAVNTAISGGGPYGVYAFQGGKINLEGGSVSVSGSSQGVFAFAGGATIHANNVAVFADGTDGSGVQANHDGSVTFTGGSVATTGVRNHGLYAIGSGATLTAAKTTVRTSGQGAVGAYALLGQMALSDVAITTSGTSAHGAAVDNASQMSVTGGTIKTTGDGSLGLYATGASAMTADGVDIETTGAGSTGASAQLGSRLYMKEGTVTTTGARATGLLSVGRAGENGALLIADGVAVTTSGENANGAAVRGGSELVLQGGSRITTTGAGAAALYSAAFDTHASTATVTDSTLTSEQGAGILTSGTTLNATLTRSTVSGGGALLQTANGGTLNLVADASALTGRAVTDIASGSISNITLTNGARWTVTGNSNVTDLKNAGVINLGAGTSPGTVLTTANYIGENGVLTMNVALGGDDSPTDKLVIDGGKASGTTSLRVNNTSTSPGVQTNKGIQVVETLNDATTDLGAFSLDPASSGYRQGFGTLSSGGYDYMLNRGGNGGNPDDWYLVSAVSPVDPDGDPNRPVNPADRLPPIAPQAPEPDAYLSNAMNATWMSVHTLRQRQGEASKVAQSHTASGIDDVTWARVEGTASWLNSSTAGGQTLSGNGLTLHVGTDVLRLNDGGNGNIRLGVMGMYGSNTNWATRQLWNPQTNRTEAAQSRGSVDGVNAGVYGTWFGNADRQAGPYVDTWLMAGTYKNTVGGNVNGGLATDSYRSRTLTGSIETGYAFPLFEQDDTRVVIEPQAQVVYSNYRAGEHRAPAGLVGRQNASNVLTRVGVRLHGISPDGPMAEMHPFAEANWWHGRAAQTQTIDGNRFDLDVGRNRLELKVGVQGQLTKRWSATITGGVESDLGGYAALKGQISAKYTWH
ncbi:autotransporter outer membrane beta-barrel domain-containing protein [Ralstonia sp. 25C]|uniref:autotransporter outer membrane beta-barrel domain-containing protein n=1 Tax=Ralstonia sp. 25C TaxID=3447363 RepID=UPI003F752883